MNFRLSAASLLFVVSSPTMATAQNAADNPAANWNAVANCAAIADADARHACVDDVLLRTGVLAPRTAEQAREDFGIDRRAAERSAAAVQVAAPIVRVAVQPPEIDEITTTIASVTEVGFQRIRVTTVEGSVWEQSQAATFTSFPKAGDAFTVEKGAVSGYRCRFARASLYRCERAE